MADDIVTRLRLFDSKTGVFSIDKNTFAEAAKVIENLQHAVDYLSDYVSELEQERDQLAELVRKNAHK